MFTPKTKIVNDAKEFIEEVANQIPAIQQSLSKIEQTLLKCKEDKCEDIGVLKKEAMLAHANMDILIHNIISVVANHATDNDKMIAAIVDLIFGRGINPNEKSN